MRKNKTPVKDKIGVLIEHHFDEHEFRRFNEFFPENGYEVEYMSYLWNHKQLSFKGNDFTEEITVDVDINTVEPDSYRGIILIGGYAMDRLRYQNHLGKGQSNQAPAVKFLRKAVKAMDANGVKIGAICHSLWLFCADSNLLRNRKVTCAHNIICDVENAGGIVMLDSNATENTYVDGSLITGKHPGVVEEFMRVFLQEIAKGEVVVD